MCHKEVAEELVMVSSYSSWTERRLRKQLEDQMRRQRGKGKPKNFFRFIILSLAVFLLFSYFTRETPNNPTLSTNMEQSKFSQILQKSSELIAVIGNKDPTPSNNYPEIEEQTNIGVEPQPVIEDNSWFTEIASKNNPTIKTKKKQESENLEALYQESLESLFK